jgi:hypothetical protein
MEVIKKWKDWQKERKKRELGCTITITKVCNPTIDKFCLECYEFYVNGELNELSDQKDR